MLRLTSILILLGCLSLRISEASTITEGITPAPNSFPSNFPGYLLPVGTNEVNGAIRAFFGSDWFEFNGLAAGSGYELHAFSGAGDLLSATLYDDAEQLLGAGFLGGSGVYFTGTVPTSGKLVLNVQDDISFSNGAYRVTLNDQNAPEPATIVTVGVALVLFFTWQMKRARMSD